jgi:hypothetical protein
MEIRYQKPTILQVIKKDLSSEFTCTPIYDSRCEEVGTAITMKSQNVGDKIMNVLGFLSWQFLPNLIAVVRHGMVEVYDSTRSKPLLTLIKQYDADHSYNTIVRMPWNRDV